MRDAGMPGFVAMIDDGMSKPFQVNSFDALSTKVGTLLLYDKLLGEGRNSKCVTYIHRANNSLACEVRWTIKLTPGRS
jgi:hypothetical protein